MDDRLLVLKLIAWIEDNLTEDLETRALVDHSGYSINRLRQKFFTVTGETPSGYVRKRKLTEAAKEILAGSEILDVCLKYGYSSQENFTTSFRSWFGVTPKEIYLMDKKYKNFISRLREVYNIMEISGLKQPPLCTTLMGCIKGAADYFDLDLTTPMLFGLSGISFLINIHEELCPSGPYAWKRYGFYSCLKNAGIERGEIFFFGRDSSEKDRKKAEKATIQSLNDGNLAMLEFLEVQLISGYDENGFVFILPWGGDTPAETKRLSFSTWEECLEKEGFAGLTILNKGKTIKDFPAMLRDSLELGLEYLRKPEKYRNPKYGIGYGAWDNWAEGVRKGLGSSHGSWWNGMVWTECRKMGSQFFEESADVLEAPEMQDACIQLSGIYKKQGENLDLIKEKELDPEKKISLIEECRKLDKFAEEQMERLYNLL